MTSDTENHSQNPPRSQIICEGKKKGTTLPCGEKLCETDGEKIFFKLPSGNECAYVPNKNPNNSRFSLTCHCGHKTFWSRGKRGE